MPARPTATAYECSDWDQLEKFSEYVFNAGDSSPVRTPRGRDILAACGQLKSATEKLSARERMALRAMAMTDDAVIASESEAIQEPRQEQ